MSAFGQLLLFRFRALWREPAILFWVFVFPVLATVVLGLAFRDPGEQRLAIVVADGEGADALAAKLDASRGLSASRATLADARESLRRGRAALVLLPGDPPELVLDPTQPASRQAEFLVSDALERLAGRRDLVEKRQSRVTAPGSRYVDFLVPGLLGMALMSSGIWGIGWALVQMRSGRLLRQLVATPMSRPQFLASFLVTRATLALVEVAFFIAFARLLFGVRVFGQVAELAVFALLGCLSFAGLSLLIAARARTSETASGLMNLATMPMMVLSGVFFASSMYPAWLQPVIRLLPLTALNDGLRAIMTDGASLAALGSEILVLSIWGGVSYLVALKIFRWT